MAPISMELKVISCKDLKAFNFFHKLSVYTVVSIKKQDPNTNQTTHRYQRQKTPVDKKGDGNPEWNHQIQFDLSQVSSLNHDHGDLFIEFELLSEGVVFGNNTIGKVLVPIKELIQECNGALRFVSYQVMGTDAKANGVLDFSCKVIDDQAPNSYPISEVLNNASTPQIYPSLDLLYPPVQAPQLYYPPPQQLHYTQTPQAATGEMFYTSPPAEGYYTSPLHFLPGEAAYYPPPPPLVYSAPRPNPYECNCHAHPYLTGDPFRPVNDSMWQNVVHNREFTGPWNVGQIR